jgi:O-antigen ligase
MNALSGMGLWALLWSGYNTGPWYVSNPSFPSNTMEFIHGVRAFFPMVAGWIALLMIMARPKRLLSWIAGPLGLMLLYAVTGLASSATLSPDPAYALYYGASYLAIVLVLLAIVQVKDPLPDLRNVLTLTWTVGIILTLSLLGAVPLLGGGVIVPTDGSPLGVRAYGGVGRVMGMDSTRNTGFARYAAMSALVALPGLMRKGRFRFRIIWGILFLASMYALIIANGRTEIAAFIVSMAVILGAERAKRTINFLIGTAVAVLLGLRGFYSAFFRYFTRSGRIDTGVITMSGRTQTWENGWRLLWKSPWVGFGFQADRLFVGQHMHNAFLHVLVQSGFLGGGAMLIALAIVWYYMIKYFFLRRPSDKSLIPPEIPALFLFVTISSLAESTFAYFSAAWLLSAPIVAYVMALHRHMYGISVKSAQERNLRMRLAGRKSRGLEPPPEALSPTIGEVPSD